VKSFARLDGIVTLVDAKHIEQHLDEVKPEGAENESVEQVAFADRLLLNKCDLVSEADLDRVEARLKSINGMAQILRTTKAEVAVDKVLNVGGFDLKRTLEMDPEFLNADGEHVHDQTVSSVSISLPGNLLLDPVQEWISDLLQNRGTDIYRMKGVLSIEHAEQRFVYQAVHMIFTGNFMEPWEPDEPRESKLVFIGKNLVRDELQAKFNACMVTEETRDKRIKMLRFAVGDKVQCNTGENWSKGTIVKLMYRDEFMPPGMVAPYQVKLEGTDNCIYAPADEDEVIKKA